MIEPAIVFVRLLQYAGAAILFGSSLFFCLAVPDVWPRRMLAGAASVLLAASLATVVLQAVLLGGSSSATAIGDVVTYLPSGKAALVRAGLAALALAALAGRLEPRWVVTLGAPAAASLAWMGHAGTGESSVHLALDILHVVTASVWLGALAGFMVLVKDAGGTRMLIALRRFSAVGVPLIALLVLSGVANTGFAVGFDRLDTLPGTLYGRVLLAKLALFIAMLGLAALNRFRLTGALAGDPTNLRPLRWSLASESALGLLVLILVAWLGTLPPAGT